MKCPYCNQDMEKGYLVSDATAIAWRKEQYDSARILSKNSDGIQLDRRLMGAARLSNAYCCKSCQKILLDYGVHENNED